MAELLLSSCGRALERTLDHRSSKRAAVGGAGMNVVLRIDRGTGGGFGGGDGRFIDRAPVERLFDQWEAQRSVANADDTDVGVARLAVLALVVEHGGRGHGKVAAAAGEFLEPPPPPGRPGG